ncbi:MAG: RNA polymerase sigma factor [Acidimicrobiia bacterium]
MGMTGGDHDGDVIAASLTDPDRFTEIFERHFDAIYAFAARRLGREVADDVGATVFVEAFAARARFEVERGDARPWLYGIATNLVHRHRRTETRRLRAYARSEGPGDGQPVDIEQRLDAKALGPRLASALGGLSEGDRDALLLFAWADLSYDDIAIATDVPVGTVRSRIHRARHRLRADLGMPDPVGSME